MNYTLHHPVQTKKSAFQSLNMVHHIWSDDLYNKQSDKPLAPGHCCLSLHYLITQSMGVDAQAMKQAYPLTDVHTSLDKQNFERKIVKYFLTHQF